MSEETILKFLGNILLSSISSGIVSTIISSRMANKQRKLQNQYEDAKSNLPVLLEILEDLEKLEQAYIFRGQFCPLIEHRVPFFSDKDGDGIITMSYAQRGHQFRVIGYRIIRNCRQVIFLTPKEHLPQVLESCKAINNFLCSKSPESKIYLDIMVDNLISYMYAVDRKMNIDSDIKDFDKNIRTLHDNLDQVIQDELPYLANDRNGILSNLKKYLLYCKFD